MKLVNQHKGKRNFKVYFYGLESHSSLIENSLNSINYCSKFIEFLKNKQLEIKREKKIKIYS